MHFPETAKLNILLIIMVLAKGFSSTLPKYENSMARPIRVSLKITEYKPNSPSAEQQLIMSEQDGEERLFYTIEKVVEYKLNKISVNSTGIKKYMSWFAKALYKKNHKVCIIQIVSNNEMENTSANPRPNMFTTGGRVAIDKDSYLAVKSLYKTIEIGKQHILLAKIFEYSESGKIYQIIDNSENIAQNKFTKHVSFLNKKLSIYKTKSKKNKSSLKYYELYLKSLLKYFRRSMHDKKRKYDPMEIVNHIKNMLLNMIEPENHYFIIAMPTYTLNKTIDTILDNINTLKKAMCAGIDHDIDDILNDLEKSIELLTDLQKQVDSISIVETLPNMKFKNILLFKS